MTRREMAERLFVDGYNCTQALVLAFEDVLDIDRDTLLKISSSFGGGMFMVAGLLRGYTTPGDLEAKKEHYALIQRLAAKFREKRGSIVCRELLGAKLATTSPTPDERTPEYYKTRPCARIVGDCAEIVAAELGVEVEK